MARMSILESLIKTLSSSIWAVKLLIFKQAIARPRLKKFNLRFTPISRGLSISSDSPTANTYRLLMCEIKLWLKREVPLLFKCRRLRLRCWSVVMLLWSIKPHLFSRQNFFRILLTSLTLLSNSLSSARAVRLEMATEIPSWSTMRPKSTISSAHSREEFEFRRLLVPTWIIIESGFRLTIGLMW